MDYNPFIIKEYEHWTLFLHAEYYYHCIGACYVWAKQEGDRDIMEMSLEERNEFFKIGAQVKQALTALFNPGRFNYEAMQNVAHHLHVHIIPRYEQAREFDGVTFTDHKWGWVPDTRPTQDVPRKTLLKLRDAMRKALDQLTL